MKTKTSNDAIYLGIQSKIKTLLSESFKIKAISIEDMLAILFILGQTENAYELEAFIDIFSNSFPVLKDYQIEKKSKSKTELETIIKDIVSDMISTDPLKATEIAKIALKPNISMEEIVKQYPEIKKYLK